MSHTRLTRPWRAPARILSLWLATILVIGACERASQSAQPPPAPPDEPSPAFRNIESPTVSWNLLSESGIPIGSGLCRAAVSGRDPLGRGAAAQVLHFGIVRRRAE